MLLFTTAVASGKAETICKTMPKEGHVQFPEGNSAGKFLRTAD
jgi:hypothetical protein